MYLIRDGVKIDSVTFSDIYGGQGNIINFKLAKGDYTI